MVASMALTSTAGICEDDDELRGILRQALEREGYTVRATSTGTEAASAFADNPPDFLILDIGLPDADGRDVCQALRARGVTAPVLFLTARDALSDRLSGFTPAATTTSPSRSRSLSCSCVSKRFSAGSPTRQHPVRLAASPWTRPPTPSPAATTASR
jgi:CheY-like chemotaxis protein